MCTRMYTQGQSQYTMYVLALVCFSITYGADLMVMECSAAWSHQDRQQAPSASPTTGRTRPYAFISKPAQRQISGSLHAPSPTASQDGTAPSHAHATHLPGVGGCHTSRYMRCRRHSK